MEPTIKKAETRGMERVGWIGPESRVEEGHEKRPDWIELPDEFQLSGSRGEYIQVKGDSMVYWAISNGSGIALVYRQLKSEYYETDRESGTCPNCQKYVRRHDDDDYLTCHRCGWQYRPLSERIKNLL